MLLYPLKKPQKADILLIESTYGDRIHPKENLLEELHNIITNTFHRGGNILVPSFAVERIQMLMWLFWQLKKKKMIPHIPIVMDSPMGANVLDLFLQYPKWHKLSEVDCRDIFEKIDVVSSYEETNKVLADKKPKIIIAGSGMITGGRILTYLEKYIGKPHTTILLTGYQAAGTRGRKLIEGVNELKIHGKYYKVKAKIKVIHSLSAHADQKELLGWMGEIKNKPEKVFVVHGEEQAADIFREKINDTYGFDAEVPKLNQSFNF
jgi:metallo-beta-lactamase family protein